VLLRLDLGALLGSGQCFGRLLTLLDHAVFALP
jgi:hypothetical protein